MEFEHFDIAIIGAGIVGSATAYYVTKNAPEKKVLLLEQFQFLHHRGSSHGESRLVKDN